MTGSPDRRPRSVGVTARVLRWPAVLAAAALVATGCSANLEDYTLPGGADVGEDPMTIRAQFDDVLDLVLQSSVKVNGWTPDA